MTDDRIPTDVWVGAQVRALAVRNIPVYVARRGAFAAGTVMVKTISRQKVCRLFSQSRDIDGYMGWMDIFEGETVDEKRADDYIARTVSRDPDIWVLEVEAEDGNNPFEGRVF